MTISGSGGTSTSSSFSFQQYLFSKYKYDIDQNIGIGAKFGQALALTSSTLVVGMADCRQAATAACTASIELFSTNIGKATAQCALYTKMTKIITFAKTAKYSEKFHVTDNNKQTHSHTYTF